MLNKKDLEKMLQKHPLVEPRLVTLQLAEKLNPKFKNPHIVGGFLRNIILDCKPNDCDVSFKGYELNQPGILEAVREAEKQLKIEPYPDWEFENISVTGYSGDFYKDLVGEHSNHTDYLTVISMDTNGTLHMGDEEKVLHDLTNRIYDLRFEGVEIWAKQRGNGRSYASCIAGDLTRGLYLSHTLKLTPSPIASFLMSNYDSIFSKLESEDQNARLAYWMKKTKGDPSYQEILDRFRITSLKQNSKKITVR
jgi:hypothetical protein